MYRKCHRFFIRKYFYPIFLLLIIIFFIKWKLSLNQQTGSQFDVLSTPPKQVLLKPIVENGDKVGFFLIKLKILFKLKIERNLFSFWIQILTNSRFCHWKREDIFYVFWVPYSSQ